MSALPMQQAVASPRLPPHRILPRLLEGIEVGAPFYASWELIEAYPPVAGAVTLVIADGSDRPLRVDVCKRGRQVRAPAYTEHLELYVMDGGHGRRELDLEMIEALQHLAELLQDNERNFYLAEELLTHRQRQRRFPGVMQRAAGELAPALRVGDRDEALIDLLGR